MTRFVALLAAFAVALTLAFAVPFKGSAPAVAEGAGPVKTCKARTPEGKTRTWRCQKDQACCVNEMLGLYVCGVPGLGCL